MRLDRILTEGEAVNALQKLGFTVREAPNRIGQYVVAHAQIGGERTFTIEQLCSFTEGAVVISTHLTAGSATTTAR
ncbi:MAG: hypothetical protein H0X24_12155 [Ktedonobacterales bacterium]|nr:hypothetical protein [Ktedonobacterales bacterium]